MEEKVRKKGKRQLEIGTKKNEKIQEKKQGKNLKKGIKQRKTEERNGRIKRRKQLKGLKADKRKKKSKI